MSEHAVTVLISRNVKAGCEADFERVTLALIQIAGRFKGYLGAQLVHPGEGKRMAQLWQDANIDQILAPVPFEWRGLQLTRT